MLKSGTILMGLCLMVWAAAGFAAEQGKPAEAPQEAVGFAGKIEGAVTKFKANGNWVAVTVAKAEPNDKSTVKNAGALVGKEVTVKVRFEKKDGQYAANAEDSAFVKGLKAGDSIQLDVQYIESQKLLGMTAVPRKAGAAK